MNLILISLAVLGVTGLVAAVLLYLVAQKFKVEEDPRIAEVAKRLNTCPSVISRTLKKNNIPSRSSWESRNIKMAINKV